jgi:hypothetical protein
MGNNMIKSTPFTSLVLIRNQPFYDWLTMADATTGEHEDHTYKNDHGTYLIKEVYTQGEVDDFILRHYISIFENELTQWHDRSLWPEELTWELFAKWFTVHINREVYICE